jgi:hypothetical protein
MASIGPRIYLALVWLYLAAIVVQVFLAGAALFYPARDFELHRNLGWILHLVPVLLLVAAVAGRVGRETIWWTVALLVVQGIQPLLPGLRADLPWVAALHPVLAFAIFWLALTLGLRAWRLVRVPAVTSP